MTPRPHVLHTSAPPPTLARAAARRHCTSAQARPQPRGTARPPRLHERRHLNRPLSLSRASSFARTVCACLATARPPPCAHRRMALASAAAPHLRRRVALARAPHDPQSHAPPRDSPPPPTVPAGRLTADPSPRCAAPPPASRLTAGSCATSRAHALHGPQHSRPAPKPRTVNAGRRATTSWRLSYQSFRRTPCGRHLARNRSGRINASRTGSNPRSHTGSHLGLE
jgi:hypothetical protein